MLDPKHLQKVLKTSTDLGQNAQADLQKPFIDGAQKMEMSGSDAARSIMQSVNNSCQKMINDMNKVFDGLQDNLDAHKKMQSEERPKDFETAMSDLRNTMAHGFPEEMKGLFEKFPKI